MGLFGNMVEKARIKSEVNMANLVLARVLPHLRRDSSREEVTENFLAEFRLGWPAIGEPHPEVTRRAVDAISTGLPDATFFVDGPPLTVTNARVGRLAERDLRVDLEFEVDTATWPRVSWALTNASGTDFLSGKFPSTLSSFSDVHEVTVPAGGIELSVWAERPGPGGRGLDRLYSTRFADVLG